MINIDKLLVGRQSVIPVLNQNVGFSTGISIL